MRKTIGVGLVLVLAGIGTATAQQRPAPGPCFQEIRRLCGEGGMAGLRECLRARIGELSAECRTQLLERMRQRGAGGPAGPNARRPGPRAEPGQVISYGADPRQGVDYYPAANVQRPGPSSAATAERPPLVLFVHGGGWAFGNRGQAVGAKPAWFTTHGYAFASAGYRVLPEAPVEEQARDVAAAILAMRADAARLGFDPDRIVLMGHSAGAHLAALVATDPAYGIANLPAIKGVILLDGAGYDVARNMAGDQVEAGMLYRNAFGDDPVRQRALSPVTHAAAPNAPNWLILHVADRPASAEQSRMLGQALLNARASVDVVGVANTDHGRLNREIGAPGDVATGEIEQFLTRITAPARLGARTP